MYNINLLITTYNRPDLLGNLLEQIAQENPPNTVIHIHNDGSVMNYFAVINKYKYRLDIRYFFHDHHGKQMYWKLINKVFKNRARSKYYIMLPDDDILNRDFFNRVIKKWESIGDMMKICLMPSINPERKYLNSWTGYVPFRMKGYYYSGFMDMRFIAENEFFKTVGTIDHIGPERWKENKLASSGVGREISIKLNDLGYEMFISDEDLTYQEPHVSQMNPNVIDRKI